jgi:hypothetical protein
LNGRVGKEPDFLRYDIQRSMTWTSCKFSNSKIVYYRKWFTGQ